MATSEERFRAAAAEHGLELEIRRWPQGTRTAQDAADAVGCEVGQIVKSLVFVADDEPILVLTSGANRVDTERVAAVLEATTVRKADADEVRDATGYAIGGTPPFGHERELRTIVDRDLLAHDVVWAAAGTPDTTFPITPVALVEASGGQVAEVAVG